MKKLLIKGLAAAAVLCGVITSNAQTSTTVILDPTQPWQGYVNVFDLPSAGGGYEFGSSWGVGALTAYYTPTSGEYTNFTLIANTNNYNPTDSYWVNADGSGNKTVDASYYVQNDTLEGQTITFSGYCISNTFVSPYTSTVFIKEFDSSYNVINSAVVTAASGQPFSITLQTGGGSHIQYGFETVGPDANPATVYTLGDAIYQPQYPAIEPSVLASQAAVQGQTVSFSETPTGSGPYTFQWQFEGTNLLNSAHISGASVSGVTNSVLTISNVTPADVGLYTVDVTNTSGVGTAASAQLVVMPLTQAQTNYVIDPSFEGDSYAAQSTYGWFSYGGTEFNNTNDYYYDSPAVTPDVTTVDGTNCLEIYSTGAGSYTGVFQDRPALPGQVYTAGAWFLTPPTYTLDNLTGNATANLQVQFYNGSGGLICDYESGYISTNTPTGTWFYFAVTNKYANDYVTLLGTSPYIVSPPGTVSMRVQPGYHSPDANSAGDAYVDMVDVTLHETTPTTALSGSTFSLSFPTIYGPQYNVLYTTNLLSGSWKTLSSVSGNGSTNTVTDTVGSTARFYIINTSP